MHLQLKNHRPLPLANWMCLLLVISVSEGCGNRQPKTAGPTSDTLQSKFTEIAASITEDTAYEVKENSQAILSNNDPVLMRILECCPQAKSVVQEVIAMKVQTKSVVFINKPLFKRYRTIYGTSIKLIEWKINDSTTQSNLRRCIDCAKLIRCGVRNTFEPYSIRNLFYFSQIYDFDKQNGLKNPIDNIKKMYNLQ